VDLLIIRHAIAYERDPRRWRDDGARPLSPAGKKLARKAAAGLREFGKPPDRLLTSPLLRARQTAQILTDVAGWPHAEEASELVPGQAPLPILTLLGRDRRKRVAVVGHQPALGVLLAVCLLGEDATLPVELRKCAAACVSFAGSPRPGRGTLQWLAMPRMLRGLRRDG
jgi:phosphohistidine phosphatase